MKYYIHNPVTGHGFDPVETDDPAAWAAERGLEGYTYTPSTYVEPVPPAPDPAAKLAADRAFGASVVEEFLAQSKNANFNLAMSRLLMARLKETMDYLTIGSIGVAHEALSEVATDQLFPEPAKQYSLTKLTDYLNATTVHP